MLGRVLVEQGGKGLLADEERIRELSRRARASGRPAARARLSEAVAKLPLERVEAERMHFLDPETEASIW